MANSQYNGTLEGVNSPTWGKKPESLSKHMNQPGKAQGAGHDQARGDSIPELMNQGGSTKHAGAHPIGHKKKGQSLGKLLGQ